MRAPCVCVLGDVTVTLLRDGRVLVTLPVARVPFGATVHTTALYPSLRACLAAIRAHTR